MARSGPPAYAWDWFTRQRLLWREVRSRLANGEDPAAARRYSAVETRTDVVPMLRADYPRDDTVRGVVHEVVAELAFLGRTDVRFEELGLRNSPRGLRWWWFALTGEEPDAPHAPASEPPPEPRQLALDEVLRGYGD
ncbi:hypothetical protein [Egicoccus sp. AB-alg2]|uniref:hypothetical protein n=1 Tax=Egicoccus sp. AB-alg2 TaxID=3242693 RepID=UPI00359E3259